MTRIQTKQISLNLWYPEFILPALRDTTHVTVIPAGRQIGKTQNTAQWLIDETMKLGVQTLWVDTVHGNIDKYVKRIFYRYFLQLLGMSNGMNKRRYWNFRGEELTLALHRSLKI